LLSLWPRILRPNPDGGRGAFGRRCRFQKKCLGKMGEVTRAGRTVLFVSHNLNAVEQLCNRVIMLEGGRIKTDSKDVRSVLTGYLFGADDDDNTTSWVNSKGQPANPCFTPQRFALVDSEGREVRNPFVTTLTCGWKSTVRSSKQTPACVSATCLLPTRDRCFTGRITQISANPIGPTPRVAGSARSKFPKQLVNEETIGWS